MEKMAIIASLFVSASMPLIILFVVVFIACMGIFWILKLVLPSQRFASESKKILKPLNLVREHLDNTIVGKASSPLLAIQSINDLKNTVLKENKISYLPTSTKEGREFFLVWSTFLTDLYGLATDANLKTAQTRPYDRFR